MDSKYQKYYDKLKDKDFSTYTSKYTSVLSTVKLKLDSISNNISNSNLWSELGIATLKNSTIPKMSKIESAVESGLVSLKNSISKISTLVSKLSSLDRECKAYESASEENKDSYRSRINSLEREIDGIISEINSITIEKIDEDISSVSSLSGLTEQSLSIDLNNLTYGNGKVVNVNMLSGNWTVANTKTDLVTYANYIASKGVRQNVDTSKYTDYCLAFSYVHAYDLYNGTKGTASMAGSYAHAGEFTDYINDNKSAVLSKVYSEISKGKPVILQVNGNKAGNRRHFVTVVGYKSNITDPTKLTEKDLLIIDSWDGKVERMDTSSSRFMTSGADCHKEYSGYRLRVLKNG